MSELKKQVSALITTMIPILEPVISSFLISQPHWNIAFHQAIGLYGYYMALKQEDLNSFIEYLKNNPEKFRKDVVRSKEFSDGFVQLLRTYLELRIKEKKQILQRILEDFSISNEMSIFPLERLDDILLKITPQSLRVLVFIKETILPIREKKVKSKITEQNPNTRFHNFKWWIDSERKRTHISSVINSWIHEEYSPNSDSVKKRYNVQNEWNKHLLNEVFDIERQKRNKIYVAIEEFVNLGIMKMMVVDGGVGGGAGSSYDFSQLGYQFIKYVSNANSASLEN